MRVPGDEENSAIHDISHRPGDGRPGDRNRALEHAVSRHREKDGIMATYAGIRVFHGTTAFDTRQ